MSENVDVLGSVQSGDRSNSRVLSSGGDFGPVVLFQGENFTLVNFGILVGLGAFLGLMHTWFYLGGYEVLGDGVPAYQLALALAFGAPFSAYVVTRLLDIRSWLSGEKTFIQYIRTVSFGLWGGLVGGMGIILGFAIGTGTPFHPLLDAFAVGIPLAQFFGRLGCLNYGCCHGSQCESQSVPAIRYYHPQTKVLRFEPELKGKRLHPTQIYAAVTNLAIYLLMIVLWISWDDRAPGALAGLYFLLYGSKRFLVEILRGEFPRVYILGITVWQWFSLAYVFGGALLLWTVLNEATEPMVFEWNAAMIGAWESSWVLAIAALILTLAYGLHGKKIGSWG